VFLSVDKKFFSLLACSILKVYNGVSLPILVVAETAATAQSVRDRLITTMNIFCFPFMMSPPFY
jgi:hypothetical protein